MSNKRAPKGRGAEGHPINRFDRIEVIPDDDTTPEDMRVSPQTEYLKDHSKTILSHNDSPDLGFRAGLNPYRGCEHGCSYCYARPTHEYLGYSSGLDFESKILIKMQAPQLLRRQLSKASWTPQVIAMSGATDSYQPVERKLELTRDCLMTLAEFRNPVAIITKNRLVTRDVDILKELARHQCVVVYLSVTTLDAELAGKLEPRASSPQERIKAIRQLTAAGIPVGVMVAPIIPGLTDHEIPKILEISQKAGARFANFVMLRLPYSVKEIFSQWLRTHYPQREERVLNRIRSVRGGELNDTHFSSRMRGTGVYADHIVRMFDVARRRYGLNRGGPRLSTEHFLQPTGNQLTLFK